ncbi:hypothetical protein FNV43_RR10867 [Rhamnella rubrinervis]|uniref:Uncharacterized protein n=1 Tax=Rhamnella rubrinervis TaxID=2594499 RepID=A0A8K0H4R0_9ROSA|nr:hypothetical protein FNV43_RR10867 [Rhamnella rubrinervis]
MVEALSILAKGASSIQMEAAHRPNCRGPRSFSRGCLLYMDGRHPRRFGRGLLYLHANEEPSTKMPRVSTIWAKVPSIYIREAPSAVWQKVALLLCKGGTLAQNTEGFNHLVESAFHPYRGGTLRQMAESDIFL